MYDEAKDKGPELTAVEELAVEDAVRRKSGALEKRERVAFIKSKDSAVVVGEPEDMIPFAWRHPLQMTGHKKVSKVLKNMAEAESERAALVPAGNPIDK